MTENPKSVAVITSTIGRPELARAIESVKNQTYPCKHYIFVDGEQFADNAKAIVEQYDNLIVTYLPMNTGANGWVNSSINAIAPYLVKGDIICYLDDDNWYEPNHIQTIVETFESCPTADFVYSLRNLVDTDGNFICSDDTESLGIWKAKTEEPFSFPFISGGKIYTINMTVHSTYHIDTNCYGFTHKTALTLAPTWFSGIYNDQHIFRKICQLNLKVMPTKKYTVNYTTETERYINSELLKARGHSDQEIRKIKQEAIKQINKQHIERYGGKRPWAE